MLEQEIKLLVSILRENLNGLVMVGAMGRAMQGKGTGEGNPWRIKQSTQKDREQWERAVY